MKLSDSRFDRLLSASSPAKVEGENFVRETVIKAIARYPTELPPRRRAVLVGTVIGGLVLAGTTAAVLPSIFDGFGRVDYQSVQEYTVDGRGPFRCEFGIRLDQPVEGVTLEPSVGSAVTFDEIQSFVQTHDWSFDDKPVALTTPADHVAGGSDLEVMSTFINNSWRAELTRAYPDWMTVVGGQEGVGQCVSLVDGAAQ